MFSNRGSRVWDLQFDKLGNSLFTAVSDEGVRIASEPTEDPTSWKRVADLSILESNGDGMSIESL